MASMLTVPLLAAVPAAKIRGAVTKTIGASDVKALDAVLAAHGLDVNSLILEKGDTFLHYAVGEGSLEMVEHLINNGARVNVANRYGYTPLDEATTFGNTDIVALLEEAGATQGEGFSIMTAPTADAKGFAPPARNLDAGLHVAAGSGETKKVVQLLERGADIEAKDNGGKTALMHAVLEDRTETVVLLLERGANIEAKSDYGWTALMYAAYWENTEVVDLLIKRGTDIEAKDKNGLTALMLAAQYGKTKKVVQLLKRGANIEAKNIHGWTALMLAAQYGKTKTVVLLLKRGANINAKEDKYGGTALMTAMLMGKTKVVDLLLKRGAKH